MKKMKDIKAIAEAGKARYFEKSVQSFSFLRSSLSEKDCPRTIEWNMEVNGLKG